MNKHKYLVFDPKTMESTERETSVSDELTKKLQEFLTSLNSDTITVSPLMVTNDLNVSWSIIETVDNQQYLTHRIILKSV